MLERLVIFHVDLNYASDTIIADIRRQPFLFSPPSFGLVEFLIFLGINSDDNFREPSNTFEKTYNFVLGDKV